ncbi:MAG: response regulator transcription factor [Elusimicrobiales bacterium]|jgi:DNA-binding response OmpR family regulator|nr:response regulator transcription factor [Elusimicrobiales bacterium]
MARKILIVEDERDISRMLDYNLRKEGYSTAVVEDGSRAALAAAKERPDLVLLDVMLPGLDGTEVLRRLRADQKTASVPVIMLTAKSEETDKIVGLELGADDYVAKPFAIKELLARIKAVLRRSSAKAAEASRFKDGGLEIDFDRVLVTVKGKPVEVTAKEFILLRALVSAGGKVLSREELLERAWGMDSALDIETRTVDVHVGTLRRKLKSEGARIVTVKNFGYRFE